jgi:hypothetical protein
VQPADKADFIILACICDAGTNGERKIRYFTNPFCPRNLVLNYLGFFPGSLWPFAANASPKALRAPPPDLFV